MKKKIEIIKSNKDLEKHLTKKGFNKLNSKNHIDEKPEIVMLKCGIKLN